MAGKAKGDAQPGRTWQRRFNHPYTARKSPPNRWVPIVGANQTAPWQLFEAAFGTAWGYRGYNPPQDGVPATWPGPGVQIPAGVPAAGQVVSIKPDLASVLNGSLDTALATFFASMPAGSFVTIWHEAEINNIGTQSQVIAMHTRAYGIFQANAPAACSYGQVVAVQSAFVGHSGYPLSAWMCTPANGGALLDFYGMDNAPQTANITYADNIYTCINQMVAGGVPANGPWTILENGYHPVWTPSQAQWYSDGWAVAQAIGAIHYMSFFSPTAPNAYVLWPAPSVNVLRVLQDIAAVARGDPRSPPASVIASSGAAPLVASGSSSSLTSTFSVNPAAGAKVLVAVQAPSGATLTVTDNGTTPATFVLDACCLNSSGSIPSVWVFRADNITLPAAGFYAVTVAQSSAATLQVAPRAYTGVQNGPPSASSAIIGTGNNPAVDPVTPNDASSLFFSAFFCDSANSPESISVASGEFTLQQVQTGSGGYPGAVADAIVTTPVSRQGGWTLPDAPDWSAVMAAYGAFPVNMQIVPGPEMVWAQAPTPAASVQVNAGLASASGWAAVNAAGGTNANAGLASASGAVPFVGGDTISVTLTAINPVAGVAAGQSPTPVISANAGLASSTGAALAAVATDAESAGLPAGTGTAQNPVIAVAFSAGLASGSGAALNATVSTSGAINAGLASGSVAALNATATIAPAPTAAAASGVALTAAATVSVTAGLASASGAAKGPASTVAPNAAIAAASVAALTATATIASTAGLASASGAAKAPTPTVGATPGAAASSVAALQSTALITVNAGLAAASGASLQPTVLTGVTANAGLASASGAGLAATATIGANPGAAAVSGAALQPAISVSFTAGLASASGAGLAATVITGAAPSAGLASVSGAAKQPAITITAFAGLAASSGAANAPVATSGPNAAMALGAGAAHTATITNAAFAAIAAGVGTAKSPVATILVMAAIASASGVASNVASSAPHILVYLTGSVAESDISGKMTTVDITGSVE